MRVCARDDMSVHQGENNQLCIATMAAFTESSEDPSAKEENSTGIGYRHETCQLPLLHPRLHPSLLFLLRGWQNWCAQTIASLFFAGQRNAKEFTEAVKVIQAPLTQEFSLTGQFPIFFALPFHVFSIFLN